MVINFIRDASDFVTLIMLFPYLERHVLTKVQRSNTDDTYLKAEKINENQVKIFDARNLAIITYKVNDTWDKIHKDFIFQPGGTNIEAGTNL